MTKKQYERHFTSIFHKVMRTKLIFKVLDTVDNSKLTPQDKLDILAVWRHKREIEIERG